MRRSVIAVVWTSTADVDRRQSRRGAVDLGARIVIPGQGEHVGRVSDLSQGGAFLHGAPDLPSGTRGTLHLDGASVALPCVVRAGGGDGLHLAFELDAAATAAFRPIHDRLIVRPAA
jgi:hypothetical protein